MDSRKRAIITDPHRHSAGRFGIPGSLQDACTSWAGLSREQAAGPPALTAQGSCGCRPAEIEPSAERVAWRWHAPPVTPCIRAQHGHLPAQYQLCAVDVESSTTTLLRPHYSETSRSYTGSTTSHREPGCPRPMMTTTGPQLVCDASLASKVFAWGHASGLQLDLQRRAIQPVTQGMPSCAATAVVPHAIHLHSHAPSRALATPAAARERVAADQPHVCARLSLQAMKCETARHTGGAAVHLIAPGRHLFPCGALLSPCIAAPHSRHPEGRRSGAQERELRVLMAAPSAQAAS